MVDVRYLRAQAARCFRLARAINNPAVIRELEAMGREFLEAAETEIVRLAARLANKSPSGPN